MPLKTELFGKSAVEAVVRFKDETPNLMMVSYYNRGDTAGELSEAAFQTQVRELMGSITQTLRVQPRPGSNTSRRTDIKEDSRVWQRPKIQFELSYSYTHAGQGGSFRAEYIRLVAKEFSSTDIPAHARTAVNPYAVRENVIRDPASGDVWISNIPMVDQGPKGYCAAATSERILRFFGQEVDQHQIAQIANTTSKGGTSTTELKEALQAVGRQYDFTLKSQHEWDFGDFRKEMANYNKLARKKGTRQVALPQGGTWYIGKMYASVDPETWMELKKKQSADYRKFEANIQKHINAGCPLAWSVTLGLYPESTRTGTGGHLRLIIGYNTKTREIMFSDTWGMGHEKKRMPLDQAFAITKSLFTLQPKGLRL